MVRLVLRRRGLLVELCLQLDHRKVARVYGRAVIAHVTQIWAHAVLAHAKASAHVRLDVAHTHVADRVIVHELLQISIDFSAAVGILEELHPEDEFSIVAFSSHAHSIFDANSHGGYGGSPASSLGVVHQASDATAVEHAMRFINGLTAEGGTNLEAAIMIGLDLALCDRAMPRRGPLAPKMQSAGVFAWFAFASALSMVVLTGTSIFICCCQKPGSPIARSGPPRLCLPGRRFL